jgi:hypothetical protein
MVGKNRRTAVLFLLAFRFLRLLLSGHPAVAIENAALRMQIAAFQRKRKRPLLATVDRVFWITLRNLWDDWRKPLLYVQPDTVVRWQRERFRKFWARLSKPQRRGRGRPRTAAELRRLIAQMIAANPLWRAPRIHGELKMLGIAISERTVSRLLRTLRHENKFEKLCVRVRISRTAIQAARDPSRVSAHHTTLVWKS